ncbi:hypothetical protein Hanom_Chr06g00522461 [Helianthus anomalus]
MTQESKEFFCNNSLFSKAIYMTQTSILNSKTTTSIRMRTSEKIRIQLAVSFCTLKSS